MQKKVFTTNTAILYVFGLGWLILLAAVTLFMAWQDEASLGEIIAQNKADMIAFALAGILSCVMVGLLSWSRVEVTAEGIGVQRLLGRLRGTQRFVPHAEIQAIDEVYSALSRGKVLRLTLHSRKTVKVGKQMLEGGEDLLETLLCFKQLPLPESQTLSDKQV